MNKNKSPLDAMIVEDEKDLSFLISLLLIQKNLKPSCVSSIADARKAIAIINPLLLFLDNRLPDGFGIDYIPEIKQEHPHTKIVMITAHNSMQEIQTAFNNGADYFISKPFNAEIIKNTIDLIIRKTFVNP